MRQQIFEEAIESASKELETMLLKPTVTLQDIAKAYDLLNGARRSPEFRLAARLRDIKNKRV